MFTFFFTEANPFSQWYACKFTVGGNTFTCAEQYMMHGKALLFADTETAAKILAADHPRQHKALGRKVKPSTTRPGSASARRSCAPGNHAKFTQNAELLDQLLATKGTTLVEASPYDKIWGIGLAATDPRREGSRAVERSEPARQDPHRAARSAARRALDLGMRIALVFVLVAGCSSLRTKPTQTVQRTTSDNTCEDVAWSCVGMRPGTEEPWGCLEGNASQTSSIKRTCTPAQDGRFALNACMRGQPRRWLHARARLAVHDDLYYAPATRVSVEADCAKQGALFVAP